MNGPGTLDRHERFPSSLIEPRLVDVWCPPGYFENPEERYPVIYMHDGQNIFDSAVFGGAGWEVHNTISHLMEAREIRGAIVVGIWNTGIRWREYMPQKPYESEALSKHRPTILSIAGDHPISDRYLQFLVQELKPFIDSHYRVMTEPLHTFVMGSSMGGLISLYAISEYPDVFGGAGCLSTHWSAGEDELVSEMAKHLPDPGTHKLYFDHGTEWVDADYEPYQKQMDECLRATGYVEGMNWITRKFVGAGHSETAWRERVHIPLSFLLG